jgi:hypothetical protein
MLTQISTLPAVPSRDEPETFDTDADSFLGALPTMLTQLNSFAAEVNQLGYKSPCTVATIVNISLSGLQTIDGRALINGDRVLVKNQTTATQNGIYIASASNWSRALDMDTGAKVSGALVPVTFGTANGGRLFYTTFNATSDTIGSTPIVFIDFASSGIIGTVPVESGGTGIGSYTTGDLIYASSATSLTKLSAAASGNVLKSGTAPSWGKVALTTDVSGALSAGNGGTGLTGPGTSGNVLRSTGTGWQSSAIGSATLTTEGLVELATTAEVQAGTDPNRAITPAALRSGSLVRMTAQATTSGTSVPFIGIPSWVKRITIMFSGVSTSGSNPVIIQIGDAEGFETTGYYSSASYGGVSGNYSSSTTGFIIDAGNTAAAATTRQGMVVLVNLDGNQWICSGTSNTGLVSASIAGSKTLSNILTQVRITNENSAHTFDAGSINVMYE